METELDEKLVYYKYDTEMKTLKAGTISRDRYSKKTIKTQLGDIELSTPGHHDGEFEPQIVPMHQRNVTGIEDLPSISNKRSNRHK